MQDAEETLLRIRRESHTSWENILNAIRAEQGEAGAYFGTEKVEERGIRLVQQMLKETGLSLASLRYRVEKLASRHGR